MASIKRKPKFSDNEIEVLVNEVAERKDILFSKLTNTVTNERKKREWDIITKKVNAVSTCPRLDGEIGSKWFDFSSRTKKKEATRRKELKKTGGGEKPGDLTQSEEKVVFVLGDTAIEGITSGIDTSSASVLMTETGDATSTTADTSNDGASPDADFLRASADLTTESNSKPISIDKSPEISLKRNKKKLQVGNTLDLVDIERQRLKIEKKRLKYEKKKYKLLKKYFQSQQISSHDFTQDQNFMDLDSGSVFRAISVVENL